MLYIIQIFICYNNIIIILIILVCFLVTEHNTDVF